MQHVFLRFPRNRPIIYLVRHVVIGQLFFTKYVFVSCFPRVLSLIAAGSDTQVKSRF